MGKHVAHKIMTSLSDPDQILRMNVLVINMRCLNYKVDGESSRSCVTYQITLITACVRPSHLDNMIDFECLSAPRDHVYFHPNFAYTFKPDVLAKFDDTHCRLS